MMREGALTSLYECDTLVQIAVIACYHFVCSSCQVFVCFLCVVPGSRIVCQREREGVGVRVKLRMGVKESACVSWSECGRVSVCVRERERERGVKDMGCGSVSESATGCGRDGARERVIV